MQWCDEEFFRLGAYQALVGTDKILLAKGGTLTHATSFSQTTEPCFYLKDFFSDDYLLYQPQTCLVVAKDELLKELTAPAVTFKPLSSEDQLYQRDFDQLLKSFNVNLNKVVLVSRENFESSNTLHARKSLFLKSLQFGTGTAYGFWNGEYGTCGSTPEILYSIQGTTLKTFALAGTSRKGNEEQLLNSAKDRYEHNLVIADLKEKLASFASSIKVGETHTSAFKDIIHLKTDIEAELKDQTDLGDLTSLISPTAALGGYPKAAALNFLKNTEYQKRHSKRFFGSAFGFTSKDFTQFLVMIRNVQWQNDQFFIESGGGIVPDSKLASELEEIRMKRAVIKNHYL